MNFDFIGLVKKNSKVFLGLVFVIGVLAGFGLEKVFDYVGKDAQGDFNSELLAETPETVEVKQSSKILIDLRGAIKNPGVYDLEDGSIVNQLITKAGGFDLKFDKFWVDQNVNFARKLKDGEKIYIPFIGDKQCIGSTSSGTSSVAGKININAGTKEQLESLPQIGPSTAQKIIDGRPYKKIEDLLNVKGIGESTFQKIMDKIEV